MNDSDYDRLREVVLSGHRQDPTAAASHLHDPDPRVRAAALGALRRSEALAAQALEAALVDPDPGVRRRAADCASGRNDVLPALVSTLADEDPRVAETAAFALGEMEPDDALIEPLASVAVSHSDALCRESAVAALGSLGLPAGLPAVLAGCRDKATVRRRAVLALAAFDGAEVTAMLEELTGDRDLQVRQAAEDLLAIERGSPT